MSSHALQQSPIGSAPKVCRPRHVRELAESLCEAKRISPKTIRNVYGTVHTLFRDAVIDEIIVANPCALPKVLCRVFLTGKSRLKRESRWSFCFRLPRFRSIVASS